MEDSLRVHFNGCLHQLPHDVLRQRQRETDELQWNEEGSVGWYFPLI